MQVKKNRLQKDWYLGFIGLVGFYKFPEVMDFFQGESSLWGLSNLLWFLWFLYFLPEDKPQEGSI